MTKEQRALLIAAKAKLRTLTEHCDPACPGWAVFETYGSSKYEDGTLVIQACDECWHTRTDRLYDDEAAMLPEAQALLAEEEKQRAKEMRGGMRVLKGGRA